jgi:hypothetical protein
MSASPLVFDIKLRGLCLANHKGTDCGGDDNVEFPEVSMEAIRAQIRSAGEYTVAARVWNKSEDEQECFVKIPFGFGDNWVFPLDNGPLSINIMKLLRYPTLLYVAPGTYRNVVIHFYDNAKRTRIAYDRSVNLPVYDLNFFSERPDLKVLDVTRAWMLEEAASASSMSVLSGR